jgi:hypothetical protein
VSVFPLPAEAGGKNAQFTGKKRSNTGGIVRLFAEEVRQYTQQRRAPRINQRFLSIRYAQAVLGLV